MMVLSEAFSSSLGFASTLDEPGRRLCTLCRELRPVNDAVQSRNNRCRSRDSRPVPEDRPSSRAQPRVEVEGPWKARLSPRERSVRRRRRSRGALRSPTPPERFARARFGSAGARFGAARRRARLLRGGGRFARRRTAAWARVPAAPPCPRPRQSPAAERARRAIRPDAGSALWPSPEPAAGRSAPALRGSPPPGVGQAHVDVGRARRARIGEHAPPARATSRAGAWRRRSTRAGRCASPPSGRAARSRRSRRAARAPRGAAPSRASASRCRQPCTRAPGAGVNDAADGRAASR